MLGAYIDKENTWLFETNDGTCSINKDSIRGNLINDTKMTYDIIKSLPIEVFYINDLKEKPSKISKEKAYQVYDLLIKHYTKQEKKLNVKI